jgi:ribosome-associated protein
MMKSFDKANKCALLAEEKKAKETLVMELSGLSDVADYFLIASGTSERHVRTIADAIETGMKEQGVGPFSIEGYREGRWVIIDYHDVIVHVFLEQLRELYDLESLWIEAKKFRIEHETKQEVEHEKRTT